MPRLLVRSSSVQKRVLEELLATPVDSMAFPTGTERVVSAYAYEWIRKLYSSCFTGLSGPNTARTDPFSLFRDSIHPHHPLEHNARVVPGALDLVYAVKMRRLRSRIVTA